MKTHEEILSMTLNYKELGEITQIGERKAKALFMKIANIKDVKSDSTMTVDRLTKGFKRVKSIDGRYDGLNELLFCMLTRSNGYVAHIATSTYVDQMRLTGGKAVYYKIMNDEQKRQLFRAFDYRLFHRKGEKAIYKALDKLHELSDEQYYYITGSKKATT